MGPRRRSTEKVGAEKEEWKKAGLVGSEAEKKER